MDTISSYKQGAITFSVILSDTNGIDPNSIEVKFDSLKVFGNIYNPQTRFLAINLPDVNSGIHFLRIIAANKNGNHAFPFYKQIVVLN